MKRTLAILLTLPFLAAPALAQDGRRPAPGGGDQSSGRATGSGQSSGGGQSGGGQSSGGGGQSSGGGSGQTASRPSSDSGDSGRAKAVPRNAGTRSGSSSSGRESARRSGNDEATRDSGGGGGVATERPGARPRDGHTVTGQAVERRGGHGGGGSTIIVDHPHGYYPWGWGYGLGYYGGYYDPFFWDDPGSTYGGSYSYVEDYDGRLRVKVKPREAEVFVDGYYAGHVDDFDGVFQKLRLESGPHRIELRQEGYEPVFFDVRIQPDTTTTYKGELKKLP